MKKVGILSDLHLEGSNIKLDNLNCDVLVLAGDISQNFSLLGNFFSYNIPEHIPVIYVPGNHEYERKCFHEVIDKLKEFERIFPNINILQNEAKDIEGIRFIGTTLWSNFEGVEPSKKDKVKEWCKLNISDFSYIFKKDFINENAFIWRPWSPDDMEEEFKKAYKFLEFELKKNHTENPKFVVTHFAPHQNSTSKKYEGELGNAYFINHLPELMGFSDYWVHGHTHDSFEYNIQGTKVICNPRGYSKMYDLSQNLDFNKNFYVEVATYERKNNLKIK